MSTPGITLTPVGVVRNEQKEIVWAPGTGDRSWRARALRAKAARESVSRLEIDLAFADALAGIDEFSYLLILWWPDRNGPQRGERLQVRPMGRQDLPLVGVFATRSPVRPNAVLTTVVKLLKRSGTTLEVTGLDALDGSPIIDIKPLTPSDCPHEELGTPQWLQTINRDLAALDDEALAPSSTRPAAREER